MPITNEDVRRIRKRLDMTQHQFAAALGLTQETVSRLETGKQEPGGPLVRLLEMIDHFGLPPGKSASP